LHLQRKDLTIEITFFINSGFSQIDKRINDTDLDGNIGILLPDIKAIKDSDVK